MFDGQKLIGYQSGTGIIYQLSGASKLLFFVLVSVACMTTYDTRFLLLVGICSLGLFKLSGIKFKDIRFILTFIGIFAILNVLMVYLFSPQYGVRIYGHKTLLLSGIGVYNITLEELFYLFNLAIKYISTVPLAILFLMTTHPSQFAASLNQIGVPYRVAYAVSLTMRYIPDMQEEFHIIKSAQEARGLELSSKSKLMVRIKGNIQIIVPLIFTSLGRIDQVSTAMELRRFGKEKKRTWYMYQPLTLIDFTTIFLAILILAISLGLIVINGGRFYNPWI